MSYFVSFGVGGQEEPVDGDEIASTRGWYDFGTWVEGLGEDFPTLAFLVEEGGVGSKEDIVNLEEELGRAVKGKPSRDVLEVGRRLLAEVKGRPAGAEEMVITDGTDGGDEDDEGDEGEAPKPPPGQPGGALGPRL
jgi:hypothetical protein